MDSAKLETFLYVCKEKSFTKAAEKLFITPAAIKKQIDSLENEIGTPLFLRTASGCTLTPAGEIFQPRARKILNLIYDSVEAARQAKKEQLQKLHIGHSVRLHYAFASSLATYYTEAYPGEFLLFDRMKKTELLSALKDRAIDGFFYFNPQKGDFPHVPNILLGTSQIHTIVQQNHPLSKRKMITFQDLGLYDIFISAVLDHDLYEALESRFGSRLHILDKEDRNSLIFSLQRNAIILYPCPVDHDISIPFGYPPLEIRLYYLKEQPNLQHFIQQFQKLLAANARTVIM